MVYRVKIPWITSQFMDKEYLNRQPSYCLNSFLELKISKLFNEEKAASVYFPPVNRN